MIILSIKSRTFVENKPEIWYNKRVENRFAKRFSAPFRPTEKRRKVTKVLL